MGGGFAYQFFLYLCIIIDFCFRLFYVYKMCLCKYVECEIYLKTQTNIN